MDLLTSFRPLFLQLTFWFCASFLLFGILARLWPNVPRQKLLRKGMATDAAYWFLMPLLYGRAQGALILAGLALFYGQDGDSIAQFLREGRGPLAALPLWLQALLNLVIGDVILYWLHRFFHTRSGWNYHAIHHSSQELDWLSATRFHPVNYMVSFLTTACVMVWLGFHPLSLVILAPVNILLNGLAHANLNWTFGPLKYVIVSPVFHRWHHTSQAEGQNKNFASTFPVLDIIFGTFYMPEGKQPERFGIADPVPESFWGQMLWPFKRG